MVKTAIKPLKGKHGVKAGPRVMLNAKQAEFARLIVSGKNQTEAYTLAYLPPEGSKPETLRILAHRIARRPLVGEEVARLRAKLDRGVLLPLNARLKILAERIQDPKTKDSDLASLTAVYSRISGDQAPERHEIDAKVETTVVAGPLVARKNPRQRLAEMRRAHAERNATEVEATEIVEKRAG